MRFTDEELGHGAFQPIRSKKQILEAAFPDADENTKICDTIDHLVRTKAMEQGVKLSPAADRVTLLRRLTFNLIGLPPTPKS